MDQLIIAQEQLKSLIESQTPSLLLQLGVGLYCLLCIARAIYNHKKRRWASLYFVLLCVALLAWAGGSLLARYVSVPVGECLRFVGVAFVPALICLHIWKQVYHKEITLWVHILALALPVVYAGLAVYSLVGLGQFPGPYLGRLLAQLLFVLYAVLAVARSYLLCLNVFYQMPKHMRRSTYSILAGLSVLTFGCLALLVWRNYLGYDFLLLIVAITLSCLYTALTTLISDDVIVTSRDFVFSSLGTTVLVLSMNGRILDWNKKGPAKDVHLPAPRYRETFSRYRKRIVQEGKSRVSPHDDDLITTTVNGAEHHYLISAREVTSAKQREYGQLVEITEVTPLYAKFRYLEEIAMVDQLTGLYNRNAYIAKVAQLMAAENMPLLIVVGDVNNLKPLNDKCGHLHGDELLKTVAKAISEKAPKGAHAFRIGGDEYVALMPGTTLEKAAPWVDSVNGILSRVHDEHFGTPSVSWGWAVVSSASEDYNERFAEADQMMYAKKRAARNFKSSGFVPAGQAAEP